MRSDGVKSRQRWELWVLFALVICAGCKEPRVQEGPPIPWHIADEMNRIWATGTCDDVTRYVKQIAEQYPDYLPAKSALVIWRSATGEDSEAMGRYLDWIIAKSKEYPQYVDDAYAGYLSELKYDRYSGEEGRELCWTFCEERAKRGAPELGIDEWHYIAAAPMVTVPDSNGATITEHEPHLRVESGLILEELYELSVNEKESLDRQIGAVYSMKDVGGKKVIPYLVDTMLRGRGLVTRHAANVLSTYGEDAVEPLVEYLLKREPPIDFGPVYCLMRIGDSSPEVIAAIDRVGRSAFLLRQPADEAIAFLKAGRKK